MKKILCITMMLAAVAASAYDDGDSQIWFKTAISGNLTSNVTVKAENEFRYGDDASEFYEDVLLLGADYTVNNWFKAGLAFQEVSSRKNTPRFEEKTVEGEATYSEKNDYYWTTEERPTLDLVFSKKLKGWGLEDRVRTEYRMKEKEDEYFRYRNRIKAKTPWKWTSLAINPYVAWEANYSDKDVDADWDRHRYYAGAGFKVYKAIKADVYYCLQQDLKAGDWTDLNLYGIGLSAAF